MTGNEDTLADLETSVQRYIEATRAGKAGDVARDLRTRWREFADLGWLGAAVPECRGGYGGPAEMAVIARELGSGLAWEPYITASVVPITYFSSIASPPQQHAALFERVMSGHVVVCAALGSGDRFPDTQLACITTHGGVKISGSVGHVQGAGAADYLLLPARDEEAARVILLVDCAASGVRRDVFQSIDGRDVAFVAFDEAIVPGESVWAQDESAGRAFDSAVDTGIVAQAAEMIGVMDRAFELTRSHLLSRRQFGQPLANFQVLRHRLADMHAELEQARALVCVAVAALSSKPAAERIRLASACKVRAIRASRFVAGQAIQLHGAIALTEEYDVGRCFTRLLALEKSWGDLDFHARRFARLPKKA